MLTQNFDEMPEADGFIEMIMTTLKNLAEMSAVYPKSVNTDSYGCRG